MLMKSRIIRKPNS